MSEARPIRLLVFGNSGAGKTTLARRISDERGIDHLDLDSLAWDPGPARRSAERSAEQIAEWVAARSEWVIEGSYADLIEVAAADARQMIFLNPGVEVCLENCRDRPWEPEKYESSEAQNANLPMLLDWVREYDHRNDEFSLRHHRRVFESFAGRKAEIDRRLEPDRPFPLDL